MDRRASARARWPGSANSRRVSWRSWSAGWWLLVQLIAQNGRLLLKLDTLEAQLGAAHAVPAAAPTPAPAAGLPVGSVAPDFSLPGLYGETLTLGALRAGPAVRGRRRGGARAGGAEPAARAAGVAGQGDRPDGTAGE